MKKIVLLIAVVLSLVFLPVLKRATISALFLSDILKGSDGILAGVTKEPRISKVSYKYSTRELKADLYLPSGKGKTGGIILIPGLVDTGKDDPRLIHLAKSLSRTGWVTLVPDFEGMRAFKIRPTDINEIVVGFLYLSSHERVNKIGFLGFSYGAGPTLLAAADQRINDKVSFMVSFGGYYDIRNLIMFVTTGTFKHEGKEYFLRPMEYARWAFLKSNLDFIENKKDRKILRAILEKKIEREEADIGDLSTSLSPEGKAVIDLLSNKDPERVYGFISGQRPDLKEMMDRLSPKEKMSDIKAHLFLVHGKDDNAIPFTESLKMAEEFKNKKRLHLYILDIFLHVDPAERKFLSSLPSVLKFYSLIYTFMGFLS
ncbi:MAG: hypothetical protein AABY78_02305 [Nitrospirota bacterium]